MNAESTSYSSKEREASPLQMTALGFGFSRFQPALQRCLCLAGPASRQQALDADVLIQVGPVDSRTLSNEPPVSPLSGSTVAEAREPSETHTDRTAVGEIHGQGVVADAELLGNRFFQLSFP